MGLGLAAGLLGLLAMGPPWSGDDGAKPLRISGSETMRDLMGSVIRSYGPLSGGYTFLLEAGGSGRGLEDLLAGRSDLAMVSYMPEAAEVPGLARELMGYDAVVLVGRHSWPPLDLSFNDLVRVFADPEVRSWAELGGPDLPLAVVHRTEASGTRGFIASSLSNAVWPSWVPQRDRDPVVSTPEEMVSLVRERSGILGYLSWGTARRIPGLRMWPVNGIRPEAGSILAGSYPLTRPLVLVYDKARPELSRLVSWILGPTGQGLVSRDFVAIQ